MSKKTDKFLATAYAAAFNGVPVNIFDLGKVKRGAAACYETELANGGTEATACEAVRAWLVEVAVPTYGAKP